MEWDRRRVPVDRAAALRGYEAAPADRSCPCSGLLRARRRRDADRARAAAADGLLDSSRRYRGNAVLPGLDGVTVQGDYADVVRPHALLVYDSGVHAYSEGVVVDDPDCG
jgi:hypothetical protein